MLIAKLLVLLTVANGTPVIAAKIFGNNSALPLDGNVTLSDGRPLFGSSKTLRGVLLSILLTTACAPLIGLDWKVGSVVALTAMIGDLFSSFVKRRLGMDNSSQFTGLDQIPEFPPSPFGLHVSTAFDGSRCCHRNGDFLCGSVNSFSHPVQTEYPRTPVLRSAGEASLTRKMMKRDLRRAIEAYRHN